MLRHIPQPFQEIFAVRMLRVLHGLAEVVISWNAAAVLGRAGTFAGHAHGTEFPRGWFQYLLQNDLMVPAITKIILIDEAAFTTLSSILLTPPHLRDLKSIQSLKFLILAETYDPNFISPREIF